MAATLCELWPPYLKKELSSKEAKNEDSKLLLIHVVLHVCDIIFISLFMK